MKGPGRATAAILLALTAQAAAAPSDAPDTGSARIEASKLTKVPKQKRPVDADYPPEAVAKGIEADVTLLLDIDAQGNVTQVSVLHGASVPGLGFDEAAVSAATQFEFEPAELDGKPIAVQVPYVYKFRLRTKPAAGATGVGMTEGAPDGGPGAPRGRPAPGAVPHPPVANFSGRLLERGTRMPLAGLSVTVFRTTAIGAATGPVTTLSAAGVPPAAAPPPVSPVTGPQGFEATSDAAGHFQFFDLGPGEWRVSIEAPGYFPYRTTELVRAGEAIVVSYFVERGAYNPFDVDVTAERPRKEVNRIVLPAALADKVPGTAGDPLAVIQDLPGVARTPAFGGEVVVWGSAPEDTQLLVEGVTVPNIYHFGGLRSVLPIGVLESIEFQPGNFDSYYGRAIGGIIDVKLKSLHPKHITGYVDVNLLDAGFYVEVPLGDKAAVAFAARRSYLDALVNLAGGASDATTGQDLVQVPQYYDYQVLANYHPTNAHDLRLMVFGSADGLAELFTKPGAIAIQMNGNRFDEHVSFYRALAEYSFIPSNRLENRLSLAAGNDVSDIDFGVLVFDVQTATFQLRDTLRLRLAPWIAIVGGVDALSQRWSGTARLPHIQQEGQPAGSTDFTQLMESHLTGLETYSPAGFTEVELTPRPGLFLSLGARADYFSRISEATFAPRLVARYRARPSVTFKGGAGYYYQEPTFDQTDPHFGNPALKAERALHLSVGAEWRPRPPVLLDGTLFYKNLTGLVSPTDASGIQNGVTVPLRYDNNGVGRVYGLELLVRHDFTNKFAGWIAYTLSRSERRDSGSSTYRLFDFDQTHILSVVATYQLPRNWQVGVRFRYVTGTPDTPVIGATFNNVTDQYDPIYGGVNTAREPAYQQLDIRLDRKWIYDKWSQTLYFDLENVYNHANPEGQSYSYDYTQTAITQGLPVLGIVGYKAEF